MSFRSGTARVLAWSGGVLFPVALVLAVTVPSGDPVIQTVLVIVALLLPAGLLRRAPVAVLLFLVTGGILVGLLDHASTSAQLVQIAVTLAVGLTVGCVAAAHRRRVSIPAAVFAATAQIAQLLLDPVSGMGAVATAEVLAIVTAWMIGRSVHQRRRYAAAQREQDEARAVQAERLRIARELHDMIAHSIGVIAVQAGMGRRVIDTQPGAARDALATIEDSSRETLAALRRMLGTLRRSDGGPDPAPGLADLDALVARTGDAGVQVELRRRGDLAVPPDIDLSAFRVIQEAVTNVMRHSGADRCAVLVDRRPGELTIEVTDEGRGGSAGPGFGIAGMRERVSLLNGEFRAEPGPAGGFQVTARIPVPQGS